MKDRGRINSEALTPFENFRGINKLAHSCGYVEWRLQSIISELRAQKMFELSDSLRELAGELQTSREYLGVDYTPPKGGRV